MVQTGPVWTKAVLFICEVVLRLQKVHDSASYESCENLANDRKKANAPVIQGHPRVTAGAFQDRVNDVSKSVCQFYAHVIKLS